MGRYAIDDAAADWSAAEAQVAKIASGGGGGGSGNGKSTLVSVKATGAAPTGLKRKADDSTKDKSLAGGDAQKKARRSMKKSKGAR